ncbi:piggyBac transposable element-derived protein 4-like isoform X2 [Larimichthys crocea]|uniref:piggyBac transposable element-derived protein 4-like isoform X2 n=1 Tax=Larimichthys crocea TaxID=215358 RepID=UPI000F5D8F86|nr:piggyBac transposable element-derived protein 4-like isoform X2 [Larimichthys crocea]XP_027137344.1 piggyBac transposable element-derived protein 4-like isoform X2 [Larimichthys crocea]
MQTQGGHANSMQRPQLWFEHLVRDDLTDEDSSDEEWNNTPTKRRGSRKRRRSVSVSPVKSPSKKWERSPLKKKIQNGATTRKNTSSPKTGKAFSTPRRGNQIGRRRTERQLSREDADDGEDRWRDMDEEDVEPPQPRFRPERDVGPQLDRTANYTPLELFQLFFSTTVIDTLVKNTNAYGKRKYQGQKESWVPVTTADMYSFLSLVLYMGIVPLKTLREFWRGSKLFSLPFPASVMPCRRFLTISRSLHMNDPAVEAVNDQKKGTSGYDKLCKIKPLYEQILEACYTFFHPYQHISIDERMVATKARIGLKQYIRNKPTKWGFKLFVLADSVCGYTLNFFVYGGKDCEPTGKGLSYDVVMRLLKIPFLGKGYKLYVDNFYTSPTLFFDLLRKKIWACGTVRPNVSGYPKNKKNDMIEKTPRGTIRWIREGDLLFVKWLDTRQVTMCSTLHKAYSNDTAKRKVKDADGKWTVKDVPIPGCIKDYNQHMGGVDLSDALISYYNVLHKTHKWYKTLFYHFVDIATVNAFILHKEMCKLQNRPVLRQKNFREQLILSLAEIGSTPRRSARQNFPTSPFKVPYVSPSKVRPAPPSDVPPTSRPFQSNVLSASPSTVLTPPSSTEVPPAAASGAPGFGHLPSYFVEQMSNVAPRDRATAGRRACVVCKRKAPVYCSTCQKTLCFTTSRNCYSEWHRRNGICI